MPSIKRDKMDGVFSNIIRTRDGWTCQVCGKYYEEGNRQGLHCSHYFSRRHLATRWDEDNACAKCFSCHQKLGENPVDFARWLEKRHGVEYIDKLRLKAHQVVKYTKYEKELIYQDQKTRLKELQK